MIELILGRPIPNWVKRSNPVLDYHLRIAERISTRGRIIRFILITLLLLSVVIGNYLFVTDMMSRPAGQNPTQTLNALLFYPMVVVQTMLGIAALALTVGVVGEEQRYLTWDNLRATSSGAELIFRTRLAAVFYRLRGPLGVVVLLRLILIGGVLVDLTAFRGRYLDLLTNAATPVFPADVLGLDVASFMPAFLLSLFLTASVILPFTTIAFDAAVGLYLATIFQNRVYSLVVQFLLFILRLSAVGGLVWFAVGFMDGEYSNLSAPLSWLLIFGFSAIADWGITLLHIGSAGELWSMIPYAVFLGPALLVFSLIQAYFVKLFFGLAVRTAQYRG